MKHCILAVLLLCAVAISVGQDKPTGFRADLLGQMEYVQKQIMDLENAIPDKKMSWRPNKEVRSISEVYLHIAFANYLLPNIAGVTPPADAMWASGDGEKWEKSTTNKKDIADKLHKSFDFVKDAIKNMPDADLEKHVSFFGQDMTVRSVMLGELSHLHEHLGQSIAYARMNGVVPPWTAAQQAAEKKEKMNKKS